MRHGGSCLLRIWGSEACYGTCLPEFLSSNALRPQVVLDAFCGIKKHTGGAYTALPYPIAGEERSSLLPCPRTPSRLGPSGLKLWPFGPRCFVPPRFWLPSAAPGRQESTMWLMVLGSPYKQFDDCVRAHLYREAGKHSLRQR